MNTNEVFKLYTALFEDFQEKSLDRLSTQPDFISKAQLYHYTSLRSFEASIDSNSLRSTSIFMMNDPNELTHGKNGLLRYVPKAGLDVLSKYRPLDSVDQFPAFVFCLSELEDDMYFWDKYGDSHRGIRIGFTPKILIDYWREIEESSSFLVPVVYQDESGKFFGTYAREFEVFLNSFFQAINQELAAGNLDDPTLSTIIYLIALTSTIIKRIEWSLEKEWRVVSILRDPYSRAIEGTFAGVGPRAYFSNDSANTLRLFVNPQSGLSAHKDILKIGSAAGDLKIIEYVIRILFNRSISGVKYEDNMSKSVIQTR